MNTRDQLLLTAEKLYGERGLNGVSLREIVRESGQKNASAAHYHFGSREGLIEAIFDKRMSMLDKHRITLLTQVENDGKGHDLYCIVDAISRPLVELMHKNGPERHYVRFLAEMFLSPEFRVDDFVERKHDLGMRRAFDLICAQLTDIPSKLLRQRFLLGVHCTVLGLADIDSERSRRKTRGQAFNLQRAVDNLTDMMVGALTAPVTPRTAAHLDKQDAA